MPALPEPPKFSIPPEKRSASYTLAVMLIGSAATAAAGIEEPLTRALVIGGLGVVAYLIGLRTQ